VKRDLVITIDGPAGAGKSTAAAELARRLGLYFVSTGALYRALAWAVRQAGLTPEDTPALRALVERTTVTLEKEQVLVNGRDVTGEIRTPEISELTFQLTKLRPVRDKMTPLQRAIAAKGGVVLEGRDTGSVVWPEADVKFYVDAALEERARRRQGDLRRQGHDVALADVTRVVDARDREDMRRELAPLVKPEGAVVVDSTALSPDEVVDVMLRAVEQAGCCIRR